MKKIIFAAIAVFALNTVNAQDAKNSKSFGVKGGVNFANITDDKDADMKVGFFAGVYGEFMLSEKFSIQPEILYSTQGTKYKENGSNEFGSYAVDATFKLDYINVPVMAKYYINDKFSIEAGPYVGFLLKGIVSYDVSVSNENESVSDGDYIDLKDQLNTVDFGLGFGAGYKVNSNISLGLRYNIGLTDVEEDAGDEMGSKNSVFQLSFGYKL